ncbi:arrestin domain-containing protein 3-like [Echeneis naucrates]|uniref:arrestin domain-containing protein 3-like n=1 Tax=Echeneis naucrates TaxID=173247 RepID=UPI00111346CB|nr:arrestin domain-containing protein 3-like [Echeneis naucrates]
MISLPSSFKGSHGKIQYLLTAKLCRPMRSNSKVKTKFTLIHKGNPIGDRMLMVHTSTCKCCSASTGLKLGQGTKVVAFIQNKLSRDIKPKYFLYKKISYFAEKKRVETKDILKEVGEAIPPSSSQTVTRIITIPPTTCVSILNCNIIRTQYRLRVYLDVKYATDPQIKFNIVILPALQRGEEEHPPAYPGFAAFYMYGGSSFPQNQTASVPSAPPPSYGTYGMYPPLTGFNGKS